MKTKEEMAENTNIDEVNKNLETYISQQIEKRLELYISMITSDSIAELIKSLGKYKIESESRIKELEEKLFIAEACLSGISKMPHMTDCECEPEIGGVCVNCYVCKHIEQALSKIRGEA